MKKQIIDILESYVDTYSFVKLSTYQEKRDALNREDRYHKQSFDPAFQTIITLGLAYPSKAVPYKGKGYGLLSRYSYGKDYHLVFSDILKQIVEELHELGIKTKAEVDSMKIDERFASRLAHMGFVGKNQFLIHKDYGSYLYLATILIDQEIEEDLFPLDDCGDCRICVDACPTNALDGAFHMNRCISYTSQAKEHMNKTTRDPMKRMVYGCDICQIVCPKNKGIDMHLHKEFEPDGLEQISLMDVLKMTSKEYMDLYKDNASSWRGLLVIKRNAIVLLANQGLVDAIPLIETQLEKYKDVSWFVQTAKASLEQLKRVEKHESYRTISS